MSPIPPAGPTIPSATRLLLALAAVLVLAPAALVPAALAQPADADYRAPADLAFEEGLARFRAGDAPEAYRLFRVAATAYPFHTRTTAALLMAARAAWLDADAARAIAEAEALAAQYPASRYAEPARALVAEIRAAGPAVAPPFDLGVVLPVAGADGYLGQAVFNGVRIAVDEHNAAVQARAERGEPGPRRPVRLHFRDSEGSTEGGRAAVEAVLAAGARGVIGPLFSDEAAAAATAAEAARVPLVAPLATDEAVSRGRQFVFQANPTFAARGRAMARYTVGRLNLRRVGVVTEAGSLGAEDGAAFAAEARRLGATVGFERQLARAEDWADLDRRVGADALAAAQAIYLPVTGRDAPTHIAEALGALDAARQAPRPIGNTEWEGIQTSRERASRLGAVFGQDFFVPPGASDDFGRRYRALAGIGEDRLALIGYDVARLVLAALDADPEQPQTEALAAALRGGGRTQGIAHRFDFGGGQVNEALFILGYRGGDAVLLE